MIVIHNRDPKLAAAVGAALEAAGHEARQVASFNAVRDEVVRSRAAAAVFAVDQASLAAFVELRAAVDPDVPVVATGTRSLLYRAFRRLRMIAPPSARQGRIAPDRFSFVEDPVAPEAVREALASALRQAPAPRRPPAVWRRRGIQMTLIAAAIAVASGVVLWALGRPQGRLLSAGFALFLAAWALEQAGSISAALRLRLRPPWWAFAGAGALALMAAAQAALLVSPG